jgi:hypothetical protein
VQTSNAPLLPNSSTCSSCNCLASCAYSKYYDATMAIEYRPAARQIFATLGPLDIGRVRQFGTVRSFGAGERLMSAGQVAPGLCCVGRDLGARAQPARRPGSKTISASR